MLLRTFRGLDAVAGRDEAMKRRCWVNSKQALSEIFYKVLAMAMNVAWLCGWRVVEWVSLQQRCSEFTIHSLGHAGLHFSLGKATCLSIRFPTPSELGLSLHVEKVLVMRSPRNTYFQLGSIFSYAGEGLAEYDLGAFFAWGNYILTALLLLCVPLQQPSFPISTRKRGVCNTFNLSAAALQLLPRSDTVSWWCSSLRSTHLSI
jgi:hypothetical protein